MRLPRIVNGKIIAVIAFMTGLAIVLPEPKLSGREIFPVILWFIAAVFTWNERVWAAILLGVLTIYHFVLPFPSVVREFDTYAKELAADSNISESASINVGIIVYAFGIIIILYILYYVAMVLVECWNERFRNEKVK